MGMGEIRKRTPGVLVGALLLLFAACQADPVTQELRARMDAGAAGPSLVLGHRFGGRIAVEVDPEARAALEQACLLEQRGALEPAIEVLGEAIEELPRCGALYEARGALYQATGFPRAAAGDFLRATGLTPGRAESWLALGQAYEALDLARQAFEALEQAERLGETGLALQLSKARVLRALGRRGLAAQHYERALAVLSELPLEVLIEAAALAGEDRARAGEIARLRDGLEACRGTSLSDEAWLLRSLLEESRGESPRELADAVRALELSHEELERLTWNLLAAVQLADGETRVAARQRLLEAESDPARRASLEGCLPRP
jgi:tetratricopeptide (TPR) repeat protein